MRSMVEGAWCFSERFGWGSDLTNRTGDADAPSTALRAAPLPRCAEEDQSPSEMEVEPDLADNEAEKAPLADARKGRAKGPTRRKPAASPSAAAAETASPATLSISAPTTHWHIDHTGTLNVPSAVVAPTADAPSAEDKTAQILPALEKEMSRNEEANTAEPPLAEPMSPEKAAKSPPGTALTTDGAVEAKEIALPPASNEPSTSLSTEGTEAKDIVSPPPVSESHEAAMAAAAVEDSEVPAADVVEKPSGLEVAGES